MPKIATCIHLYIIYGGLCYREQFRHWCKPDGDDGMVGTKTTYYESCGYRNGPCVNKKTASYYIWVRADADLDITIHEKRIIGDAVSQLCTTPVLFVVVVRWSSTSCPSLRYIPPSTVYLRPISRLHPYLQVLSILGVFR